MIVAEEENSRKDKDDIMTEFAMANRERESRAENE